MMKGCLAMRRLKALGSIVLAALALAIITAASASAVIMTLPEFVTKTGWKGESKAGVLRASGLEINCTAGTNHAEMEASKKLGSFSITFTTCSSAITDSTCQSGETAGEIVTEGSWHLVLTTKSADDIHLIWFLLKPFTATCNAVHIEIKGTLLGEITPVNKLTKNYDIKVNTVSAGGTTLQEYTSFENDGGELVSASLLAASALGFHSATERSEDNTITTTEDTLVIN
jgi:hypothetical protein